VNIKLTLRAAWGSPIPPPIEVHLFLGDYAGATAMQPGVMIEGVQYSIEGQVTAVPPAPVLGVPAPSPDPNTGRIASALEQIARSLAVPTQPEDMEHANLGAVLTLGMHNLGRIADTTELGRDQLAEEVAGAERD
jgi:hypothetical protein